MSGEGGEKTCEHVPVLLAEVMAAARVQPGSRWIDGTFGRGGHSSALLAAGAQVLALDRDGDAEPAARILREHWQGKFEWKQRNFEELTTCAQKHGWSSVDGGILLDLGVSSPQLDTAERGFSFQSDGPLDMRMDTAKQPRQQPRSGQLSDRNRNSAEILYEHGDEREARRVARVLVARRRIAPRSQRTADLAGGGGRGAPAPASWGNTSSNEGLPGSTHRCQRRSRRRS